MAYGTTTLNLGAGGDEVAVDVIGGADHQRVKLGVGGEGTAADFQQPLTDTQLRASAVSVTEPGGTPFYGTQAVTATEAALANHACREVTIKALNSNVIPVYLGVTGVTTSTGYQLSANEKVTLKVSNTNLIFVIASTTGASVCFIGTN